VAAFLSGSGTQWVWSLGEQGGTHQGVAGLRSPVVVMAGWADEQLAFGVVPSCAASQDVALLGYLARWYGTDPDVERAKWAALSLLADAWPAVEALARELVQHCTITGAEAERIFEAALTSKQRANAALNRLQAGSWRTLALMGGPHGSSWG
jgi:hypothetical protein